MIEAISRRSLLAGMAVTGAVAMLEGTAIAAKRRTFFARVGLPVGLQVYTLGDEAGRDIDATFAQIAAIGYREIELPSLYNRKPADLRAAADKAGLAISSLHIHPVMRGMGGAGLTLGSAPAEIADALGALGAKRAALPIAPFPDNFRPQPGEAMQATIGRTFAEAGADHWRRTAAMLNEKGAALRPLGVALGYHNHNMEFAPIGGTTGWDILVKETDPAAVHFEVDVGWVATAGLDPAAFLRQHRGRVAQLHVKDVAAGNTTNFALSMKPAEVGSGTLDWAKILPAAHDAGVRHFYVEQEPPFAIPRIEAARKGYAFLAQLRA
ncbi:sugar phosphate isomerase/epimerase family protein [Novosphingobium sp. JCM 18896]|uniref:sugar phosphate isomerase/epimerase family protein n=1 Tax=Novosphingobium sp. JCM 18896 TaxID=2989731 RepID=UPI0022221077|nr:sugar phosphate isomerase/epimerase [Novosphingobium sp. JCM 18896]MCW1429478.1 sugar phosphate isomerase/epimerase [Novosphingobium sp. JCM 18896]